MDGEERTNEIGKDQNKKEKRDVKMWVEVEDRKNKQVDTSITE